MTPTVRRLAGLLIAAAFLLPQGASASTLPAAPHGHRATDAKVEANAVTWKIDHASRTITASVRLQLGSACTRQQYIRLSTHGGAWQKCQLTDEIADRIKAQIDSIWNKGLTYGCYKLKVEVDIKVLKDLDGMPAQTAAAGTDRLHIAIDQTGSTGRSGVQTTDTVGAWNGRSTSDRIRPLNDTDNASVWRYPPTGSKGLYAHELGHVLGLDDGYMDQADAKGEVQSVTRPDAIADDLMTDDDSTKIDPSTVEVLVERAGITIKDLRCDFTADQDSPLGPIRGTKCGGLDGDWVLKTNLTNKTDVVVAKVKQTFTITNNPGTATDTFVYADSGTTKNNYSTTTSEADAKGTATLTLNDDGSVTWTLTETKHTQSGTARIAGKTIRTPKADAPLVTWTWDWRPTVCTKP